MPRSRLSLALDDRWIPLAFALVLLGSPAAHAIRVAEHGEASLDLHLLLQPAFQLRNTPDAEVPRAYDFYLRRTRLILGGRITRWLSFFFETDQPNWGKGGDWAPAFFVQDAVASFELHRAVTVDAGLLLLPFVHNALQGAVTLHTLDYHGDLVRYPAGSHKVWRDVGAQVRGLVLDDRVGYRVALTTGRGQPEADAPRLCGRVTYNFLDAEDGLFFGGTYLGSKRVLSVGAAADYEHGALGPGQSFFAVGGDVFLDLPLGERYRLSGQLAYVRYAGAQQPPPATPEERVVDPGQGLLFDLGFAIRMFEPLVAVDWFRPSGQRAFVDQLLILRGGLNWWLRGHDANLKLEVSAVKSPGAPMGRAATHVTLQTQLFL